MGVITISRKTGSLGNPIGQIVARKLGMKCVNKDFIGMIVEEYGFSYFNQIYQDVPNFFERYKEFRVQTLDFVVKTIEAIGAHDNVVIVGRGGFEIFENYADVLNVRTSAPFDVRVKRKSEQRSLTEKEAVERIIAHDKARRAFLYDNFQHRYNNTRDFDLVINTAYLSTDYASDVICESFKNLLKKGRNKNSKYIKDLKVDAVLEDIVTKRINEL